MQLKVLQLSIVRTIDLDELVNRKLFSMITASSALSFYFIEMVLVLLTSGPKRASRCEHHQELAWPEEEEHSTGLISPIPIARPPSAEHQPGQVWSPEHH